MTWSDERLQDRFDGIDRRFDAVDRRFDSVDRRFERVEGEILELRREMNAGFNALREEIDALRTTMFRFGGALVVAVFASGFIHG